MAIIPKAQINKMVSTDVSRRPTQSIESAGLVGKGIESFAKGLGDVGEAFLQVNKQQEKLAAETYANNNMLKAELEINDGLNKLKAETKGDHKDYFDKASSIIKSVKEQYLKGTDTEKPNELGKQVFASRFGSVERRLSLNSLDYQTQQRTKYLYMKDQEADTLKANNLSVNPDHLTAIKYMEQSEATYKNPSKYQGDTAQAGIASARNSIFEGLMNGYENTDDAETALSILNKEMPESNKLLQGIDEGKVQTWRRRFENLSNVNKQVKSSVLNKQFTDAESAIMDRMQSVEETELNNLQQMYIASGDMNKAQSVDMLKASNSLMQRLKTTPNKELDMILTKGVENLPEFKVSGQMNAAEKVRLAERFKTSIEKLKELKETKGADFIHDNYRDIQNIAMQAADIDDVGAIREYAAKTIAHQNSQNIKNPKVLTDNLAEVYASQINISKNPDLGADVAAANVEKLKAGFGEHSLSVAKELVDRKLITQEQSYAFYLDNPESVKRLMELQNPQTLEAVEGRFKIVKENVNGAPEALEEIGTDSDFKELHKALVQATGMESNVVITDSLVGIMQKDYKYTITSNDISPQDAKKQVMQRYMSNWQITGNDTPVVIPTVEVQKNGYNVDKIEDNIDELKSAIPYIQETVNIPVPPTYQKQLGKDAAAKWSKDLKRNGKWVTSPEMDGVVLMLDMGAQKPVAPKDKDGNLIKVTYKELNQGFDLDKKVQPTGIVGAVQNKRKLREKLKSSNYMTKSLGESF